MTASDGTDHVDYCADDMACREVHCVANRICRRLCDLGYSNVDLINVRSALQRCLGALSRVPELRAVGFLYRDEAYTRPLIDLTVLLAAADIALDDTSTYDLFDRLNEIHADFADAAGEEFDSFLDIVDSASCADIPAFHAALDSWARDSRHGAVLACLALDQRGIVRPN